MPQLPGITIGTARTPRSFIATNNWFLEFPGLARINGTVGIDGGNTGFTYDIREGWPLGKITASGKYVPCKRTRANGSGSSATALIVDHAEAFAAGDSIVIGSNSAVAISSIVYSTNTITIASAKTWSDNDAVATADGSQTCMGYLSSFVHLRDQHNLAAADASGNLLRGGMLLSAQLLGDTDAIWSDAASRRNMGLLLLDSGDYPAAGSYDSIAVTGDLSAGSITGYDSALAINGLVGSSSNGGTVTIQGGTGNGGGNVGGVVSMTGGTGTAAGAGGAASVVGGTPASGNAAGGAADLTGGLGSGSSAGGASAVVGGRGGATGTGGAASVTSGGGGSTSGASGTLTLATGVATADSTSASGAISVTSGAGCTGATSTNGGASGAVTLQSGAGGTTGTGTAGASGAVTLKSANGGAATGAGTGGASGAVAITSGNGGATTTSTAGKANSITLTGGNGGAASGAGTGGQGASIVLQGGTGGTTSGGTAGVDGVVMMRGLCVGKKVPTVTAMTTTATITGAALLSGLITANQGAAGAATYTMPVGTVLGPLLPTDFTTGDTFDFSIVNISTNTAEIITVAGDTGMTAVGNMVVSPNVASPAVNPSATFRVRMTGANAFSFYRIG